MNQGHSISIEGRSQGLLAITQVPWAGGFAGSSKARGQRGCIVLYGTYSKGKLGSSGRCGLWRRAGDPNAWPARVKTPPDAVVSCGDATTGGWVVERGCRGLPRSRVWLFLWPHWVCVSMVCKKRTISAIETRFPFRKEASLAVWFFVTCLLSGHGDNSEGADRIRLPAGRLAG